MAPKFNSKKFIETITKTNSQTFRDVPGLLPAYDLNAYVQPEKLPEGSHIVPTEFDERLQWDIDAADFLRCIVTAGTIAKDTGKVTVEISSPLDPVTLMGRPVTNTVVVKTTGVSSETGEVSRVTDAVGRTNGRAVTFDLPFNATVAMLQCAAYISSGRWLNAITPATRWVKNSKGVLIGIGGRSGYKFPSTAKPVKVSNDMSGDQYLGLFEDKPKEFTVMKSVTHWFHTGENDTGRDLFPEGVLVEQAARKNLVGSTEGYSVASKFNDEMFPDPQYITEVRRANRFGVADVRVTWVHPVKVMSRTKTAVVRYPLSDPENAALFPSVNHYGQADDDELMEDAKELPYGYNVKEVGVEFDGNTATVVVTFSNMTHRWTMGTGGETKHHNVLKGSDGRGWPVESQRELRKFYPDTWREEMQREANHRPGFSKWMTKVNPPATYKPTTVTGFKGMGTKLRLSLKRSMKGSGFVLLRIEPLDNDEIEAVYVTIEP